MEPFVAFQSHKVISPSIVRITLRMTEPFDPYRKWLGIPAQDQPPNHYRLLGIELFEADPDVISNAADGRMAQIKNFQAGKHSQDSQRILNELAAAKVGLLNPTKRAAYDRQLREQLASDIGPAAAASVGEGLTLDDVKTSPVGGSLGSAYALRRERRGWAWQLPAAIVAISVVVVVLWVSGREEPATVARQPGTVDTPADPLPTKPTEIEKPSPPPEQEPPKLEPPKLEPPKSEPVEPTEPEIPLPVEPSVQPPAPEPVEEPEAPEPEETFPEPKRRPVPDLPSQQAAEARIREIFGEEFDSARTSAKRLELASKLSNQARETRDDPAVLFMLLKLSSELAAAVGESTQAFAIADRMCAQFELNPLEVKFQLFGKVVEAEGGNPRKTGRLNAIAMQLADQAVADDDYENAGRFLRLAVVVAHKSKDLSLKRDLNIRSRELNRLRVRFGVIKKSLDLLAENPNDAEANLTVGKWYCYSKNNWRKGLPFLAAGSDESLAELAKQDLAAPTDPAEQMSLADRWWEIAEKEGAMERRAIQARAASWYQQARPKLSGLNKAKVEKRLEEFAAAPETHGPKIRGVVQPGNVALASNGTILIGAKEGARRALDGSVSAAGGGYAVSVFPCEWTILFRKVYRLREIRFLLYNQDSRFYRYAIETSADGKKFKPLADRSRGQWSGWQQITFPAKPVKAVKLIGLYNSRNPRFHVTEFEAYCIPPK